MIALRERDRAISNQALANANERKAVDNATLATKNEALAKQNEGIAKQNETRALRGEAEARDNAEEARKQAQRALARQLAAQSAFLRDRRTELPRAALLAAEAVRRYPTAVEADEAVRGVLALLPKPLREIDVGGPIDRAIFGPDARMLLVARNRQAETWDLTTGKRAASVSLPAKISGMALREDGRSFVLTNVCAVSIYDSASGRQLAATKLDKPLELSPYGPPCATLERIAISPDGKLFAANRGDGTRVWNVETGEVRDLYHSRAARASPASGPVFSPDGKRLAIIRTGDAAMWSTKDWKQTNLEGSPPWASGEEMVFSRGDGDFVAAVSGYGVAVWSTTDGQRSHVLSLGGTNFTRDVSAAFNAVLSLNMGSVFEGSMIAASSGAQAVVWDLTDSRMQSGQELARIAHEGAIWSMMFDRNSNNFLTVSQDNTVSVWETHGGREVSRVVHAAPVVAASFGEGASVWTVDSKGKMRSSDLSAQSQKTGVVGTPISFSPDGNLVTVAPEFTHPGTRYRRSGRSA